jgi:hypothetical protein
MYERGTIARSSIVNGMSCSQASPVRYAAGRRLSMRRAIRASAVAFLVADLALALRLERVERQAERPGDEPRGLVERVAGAVAERHARLLEPLGRGDDELDQGHRTNCSRVER